MYTSELEQIESQNKKRSLLYTSVLHIAILLLVVFMGFSNQAPLEDEEGGELLISLGSPDVGMGDDNPMAYNTNHTNPDPVMEEGEVVNAINPVHANVLPPPAPKVAPPQEIVTDEVEESAVKVKQQEDNRKVEEQRLQLEEESRRKAAKEVSDRAMADAKAKAQADADAKAAKDAAYQKAKSSFGGAFKNNGQSGTGRGNSNTAGNGGDPRGSNFGDPDGSPDGSKLEGIGGNGKGNIGGGLKGRKVISAPRPVDNTNATGRVVVKVCVDGSGRVNFAEYTQSGSTTTDQRLRDLAVNNAKTYKFDAQPVDKQCGTITYDFRVK